MLIYSISTQYIFVMVSQSSWDTEGYNHINKEPEGSANHEIGKGLINSFCDVNVTVLIIT